ncbi:MAG: alpha/beta-hydrolase family protein [Mobilicoccus sp.]|nr:alpha/beta-hydrolase family protein [Mobilicoccus sp.]
MTTPPTPTSLVGRLRWSGIVGAIVMGLVALSPSFIPRLWWMTAFNLGVCLTYGYGLGVVVAALGRAFASATGLRVQMEPHARRVVVRVLAIVGLLLVAEVVRRAIVLQGDVSRRVGGEVVPLTDHALGVLGGLALFGVLLLLCRSVRALWRLLRRLSHPFVPGLVSTTISLVIVAWLVVFVSNDVLFARFIEHASRQAVEVNAETPPGRVPPVEATRSGGPGSPETWASLGRQGQGVVADGPRQDRIEEVTGAPAVEPIRVYAGLRAGRDLAGTADAVVAELHRTGAFDRSVLVVMMPAGEGWIPDWHPSAVEFLTGGDSAIASMQYTYLPSALGYLTDRETARAAARLLITKVEAEIAARPAEQRPRLFIGGESLGAYAGQAAFAGKDDLLDRIDGAVWTGTPRDSELWKELTSARRDGSPEIAPVVDGGEHIRFVTEQANLVNDFYGRPFGDWEAPRVAFAQNPNDPIVWWAPDLLWREPDWLREHASPRVTPAMTWAPWVTFWQIASDMPRSVRVPGGEGHRYQEDLVPLWAGVLGLDPMADYSGIQEAMREDYRIF